MDAADDRLAFRATAAEARLSFALLDEEVVLPFRFEDTSLFLAADARILSCIRLISGEHGLEFINSALKTREEIRS